MQPARSTESYLKQGQAWISRFARPETPLYAIGWAAAAIIILFTVIIFWSTFVNGLPSTKNLTQGLGADNWAKVFTDPTLPKAAVNTIVMAIGTTLVALLFATPIAWLVHRTNVRLKKFWITLMLVHSLLPGFVRIMGWIMLVSPKVGIINQAIRAVIPMESGPLSPYNIPFMIFLQGISLTPVLFLMLGGAFMAIDPSLEEAAEANGMSKPKVFWRISLPLLKPSIFAGAVFVFITALSMFEVAALLGSPYQIWVFSTLMYTYVKPPVGMPLFGVAGVYGVITLIPTMIALFYYQRMIKLSHRYQTVTGKGYRPRITELGRWRWVGLALILLFFFLDLVLPYLAVFWTSISPTLQVPSMSAFKTVNFSGYAEGLRALGNSGAVWNTVKLLLATSIFSMIVGLCVSWITLRTKIRGRYALDGIAMLPQAVPGIAMTFAAAFAGIMLYRYIPIYGTIWIIVLVGVVRLLPFTTRTLGASLLQIHPELEEAVLTSGGSKWKALRTVIVPLVTPAMLYSFVWAILQTYRDVTTPLFLQTPDNMVLSTIIWQQWVGGANYNAAAAISVMMVTVMAIFVLILLYVFKPIRKSMLLH